MLKLEPKSNEACLFIISTYHIFNSVREINRSKECSFAIRRK